MNANTAPHAADIAIGISAINLVFVIQVYRKLDSLLWALCPLQYLQMSFQLSWAC